LSHVVLFSAQFEKWLLIPLNSEFLLLKNIDFFLWGFCKNKVYRNKPKTLEELENAIQNVIFSISMDALNSVIDNFNVRLRQIYSKHEAHIEHIVS
jgi:hypothetical protein